MPLPSRRLEKARREARDRLIARGLLTSVAGKRLVSLTEAGKRLVAAVLLTDRTVQT
jgi:helix-turn-helix protein